MVRGSGPSIFINDKPVHPRGLSFEAWPGLANAPLAAAGWLEVDWGANCIARGTVRSFRRERRPEPTIPEGVDCLCFDGFEPVAKPMTCVLSIERLG